MLYPLILAPVLKDYLWGGTKLKDVYHKQTDLPKVAESWELACHKEGTSVIQNGLYAGKTMKEYIREEGPAVLGKEKTELPLLIKIIDTADSLSVQVHPDDRYAAMNEDRQKGKTELWYIMDCEPGATLFYGFEDEASKGEVKDRAKRGTITEILNRVPVKKGDVFLIKPGMVHAIGKDMTVAEIGTNSNITYRIYDFDRVDAQGAPRELHIEKAADVLCTSKPVVNKLNVNGSLDCGAFQIERVDIPDGGEVCAEAKADTFHHLLCVEGNAILAYENGELNLPLGSSAFIPAGMGAYVLRGSATVLKTTV